jgi:hypothetical protein
MAMYWIVSLNILYWKLKSSNIFFLFIDSNQSDGCERSKDGIEKCKRMYQRKAV